MTEVAAGHSPDPFVSILRLGLRIQHINARLENDAGLSLTQWSVLKQLLDNPTISPLDLAELLGIQPSTLTQTLKRLNRKGLILVKRDPLDGRRKLLSLTRTGNSALVAADNQINCWKGRTRFSIRSLNEVMEGLAPLL